MYTMGLGCCVLPRWSLAVTIQYGSHMNTSTPPETPKADDTPTSQSNTTTGDGRSKMIFTVFPRDATSKQIADALNKLRAEHAKQP
jgi:hypothetical protein